MLVGYDVGGEETVDHSKRNDAEGRPVAPVVDELRTEVGLEAAEIGVITPYMAQVDVVRTKLASQSDRGRDVTVDAIDSVQGSEKVAIVISLVRSNADDEVGFLDHPLDGPRRLNVEMTCVEQFCALAGDWYTLRGPRDGTGNGTGPYDDLHSFIENTERLRRVEPEFIPVPE